MDDKNESSTTRRIVRVPFYFDWRETLLLLDDFLCDEKVFALRKRACVMWGNTHYLNHRTLFHILKSNVKILFWTWEFFFVSFGSA